jgi:FlaA1/EpsC-like NDP-sugar epimerase
MTADSSTAADSAHPAHERRVGKIWSRHDQLAQSAWAVADALVVVLATFAAAWVRYDLRFRDVLFSATTQFAAVAAAIYLVFGVLVGPYRIGHLRGSFEETTDIAQAAILTAAPLVLLLFVTGWFPRVPRSLGVFAPALALVGMFTVRFIVRSYRWGRRVGRTNRHKVIIFGAGTGGRGLVRALRSNPTTSYTPVALLDDDLRKRRLKIDGVRVCGTRQSLPSVAARTDAAMLVIAVPSAGADLVSELRELARPLGLNVLVLPPTDELIGGQPREGDLRRLNLEDLLGRRRIELDDSAISGSIAGKVVLVTGAGGSIGSELVRQIARFGPNKLVLLDRDESALHGVQMSLTGRALLDDGTLALTNIRDLRALRAIFRRERPQLVFHAAALKHLTLLEQFPLEAWKTNVLGTLNVLRAAYDVGVEAFVNVSTDKAADPSCVLGYSKRIAERLTADFAHRRGNSRFVSVRFGNVLGSRGSVIPAFTEQIKRGGPITVTDPNVERFFMLIPEASQLVLQASAIGQDGDVLVLDMGRPVKIVEVAKTLIELSGRHDIDITFTGMRPGEKVSEELFTPGEDIQRSSHPLVNRVSVPTLSPDDVNAIDHSDPNKALRRMQAAATGAPPMAMARPIETVPGPPTRRLA